MRYFSGIRCIDPSVMQTAPCSVFYISLVGHLRYRHSAAANAHIVVVNPQYRPERSFQNNDNPEHDWGFGQILPFVMLLLPILTALDYLESIKSKRI